jgi:diaminopimelate epimerase
VSFHEESPEGSITILEAMKFTKMHGIGNDYIYVDGFTETVPDPPALARRLSDRHRGVGGDGLIILRPPTGPGAACRMEMYNADGSRAPMCGNGIRCVGKLMLDRGRAAGPSITIETDAGPRTLRVAGRDGQGRVNLLEVDMGAPLLGREEAGFRDGGPPGSRAVEVELRVQGRTILVTAVSMGNPHCVVRVWGSEPFGARLSELELASLGPPIERHPSFPARTNVEFVEPRSRRELDFRVWERGSGETLACGTGACAAVVAGVLGGWCDRSAVVHLRGGDLEIRWDEPTGRVFMTGPAEESFTGEVDAAAC